MLPIFVTARLPTLIQSLGIALTIAIIKKMYSPIDFLFMFVVIFNTLWLLQIYAPLLISGLIQGVGYSVGFNMTGGAGNAEACNCKNPMSIKSIFKPGPSNYANSATNVETKIIPRTEAINVNSVIDKTSFCKALTSAGFNPAWTIEQIDKIKETPSGNELLKSINEKALKLTGLKQITHEQILQCFPKYVTTYQCKAQDQTQSQSPPNLAGASASASASASANDKSLHCHWESIKQDLTESISRHYSVPNEDKQKTLLLKTYVIQRAELEFKNQINLFQNKSKKEWYQNLSDMKQRSLNGYQLNGTDYYIPWDLFEKYEVCFGS